MNLNTVFAIAGAALGCFGLVSALFAIRAVRRWQDRCSSVETRLEALRRELDLVASISLKTGRRVKRVEQEYSGVSDRVDLVELRAAAPAFDQAIDSARRGADPGRLTAQFGLSRGEADLVTRLHGRKKSA
ncbi:MAG TPA: DUF2802 domain-containing protein [Steroidobacteraceae bacterium]|nr:DUF2802 domain-containing protein [Steroidobacteraceae bacterium]